MKQWKKLLGIFMSGVLLMTGGVLPKGNAATAESATDYGISNPRIENGVTTWDKIKFGSYYQDAEVQPAEPIKWRVLSVDENNNAFLLADEILDCKPYHDVYEDEGKDKITWETSSLRKWLNNDFYNEAFDADEKKAVMETTVVNENNPSYDTEGGNDTKDKVYLLSIAEAGNVAYGFDTEFNKDSKTREAKKTDYAKVDNIWSDSDGYGEWWLRSMGDDSSHAAKVYDDGYGSINGSYVGYGENGVRPALHINLSSSEVEDAGEVDSEGNVTMFGNGISNPVVKDGVTTWDCVYFGNYRQNCTFKKQNIEWRVLSVDGDDAFLLADRNLDCKSYNEGYEDDVTWETCTLRKWLKEDFYNEAFDADEKKAVMETTVVNENSPYNDTEAGNETKDKVYLLSIAEAGNAAYGFDTEFDESSKTREAKNTDYAKVNNVYSNSYGYGYWWLRSPGDYSYQAAIVYDNGYGNDCGDFMNNSIYGVRPALHINLSSSMWSKVGEVRSDGQGDDSPTASPAPTASPMKNIYDWDDVESVDFYALRDVYDGIDDIWSGLGATFTFKDGATFEYDGLYRWNPNTRYEESWTQSNLYGYGYGWGDDNHQISCFADNVSLFISGNITDHHVVSGTGTLTLKMTSSENCPIAIKDTVEINVVESPVKSIEPFGVGVSSGSTGESYTRYGVGIEGIVVTYKDETRAVLTGYSGWEFDGVSSSMFVETSLLGRTGHGVSRSRIEIISNQEAEHWEMGKTYPVTVCYLGAKAIFSYTVGEESAGFKTDICGLDFSTGTGNLVLGEDDLDAYPFRLTGTDGTTLVQGVDYNIFQWAVCRGDIHSSTRQFIPIDGAPTEAGYYRVTLLASGKYTGAKFGYVTVEDKKTPSPEVTLSPVVTVSPVQTDKPTVTIEPTKVPEETDKPTTPPEPAKTPESTDNLATPTGPTQTPAATVQQTPPTAVTQTPTPAEKPVFKQLKLSVVKCAKNTKRIIGKVSASKASIKIKVGKKAYKKATVKGKKFTLKLNYKLKKKTKVTIKAEKKGYKSLIKSYTVK